MNRSSTKRRPHLSALVRAAVLMVPLLYGSSAPRARAHEADHFTPPPRRPFAELGPAFTRDFYDRIDKVVADTNARIERTASGTASIEELRSPAFIARAICARFGMAGFYIDKVNGFVHSAALEAQHPGLITAHRASPSIYDEALLPVDPRKFYLLWRGSVFVINGVYVSSDKIGHFIHHGHNYYRAYRRNLERGLSESEARYKAAVDVGTGGHFFYSEWRVLGTLTSGVVSNADLAANYIGMLFYINLTQEVRLQGRRQPPILRLVDGYWRLSPHVDPDSDFIMCFFSPHFDEALNPNRYDALTARVLEDVMRRRCAELRLLYLDENGAPRPMSWFLRLREELSTYYGEPYGHTGIDEEHLRSIANVCCCDDSQQDSSTAADLRRALRDADHEAVAALLAAGADADSPAEQGDGAPAVLQGLTILHAATRAGHARIVEQLLAAGADARATTARGETPLHFASTGPVAQLLLNAGAAPQARDTLERTPLHWAAQASRADVAAVLLEAGVDLDAADCDCETALHIAARVGSEEFVALLLQRGSAPNRTALYDTTPLHLATRHGHTAAVALLLAAGANASAPDAFGCTPLHDAAVAGDAALATALLEAGADPYAQDALGNKPIRAAARAGRAQVVRELERALAVRARDLSGEGGDSFGWDRPPDESTPSRSANGRGER